MAAYDQVLAKLKNMGSKVHSEEADKQPEKSRKRIQRSRSEEKEDTRKKAKIKKDATLAKQEAAAAAAAATDSKEGSSSRSEAAVSAEEAVAVRASHTARFGRRRAGKDVRRCCPCHETFSDIRQLLDLILLTSVACLLNTVVTRGCH